MSFFTPSHRQRGAARWLPLALTSSLIAGCAGGGNLGYYWQSLSGHLHLMHAAHRLDDWIARPDTSSALRDRLELAKRARDFAVRELHLPDNASYSRYAQLPRTAAVWNVVAAPAYSLQLHTWCFPVLGCVGYRGYFSKDDAQREAKQLESQGLEVDVYGVPAYSTLGAMNWAGGDPLLSTFIEWPEGDFVRLLFHELAHQVVYAKDDTLFNESFATAVGRLGSQAWLRDHASAQSRAAFAQGEERREAFRALTRATRERLAEIYKSNEFPGQEIKGLDAMKKEAMAQFRSHYLALSKTWDMAPAQRAGYDAWVRKANNASFGAQAAYDELVPAFEALFDQSGREWPQFYDAVRALSRQPPAEREAALRALMPSAALPPTDAKDPPLA